VWHHRPPAITEESAFSTPEREVPIPDTLGKARYPHKNVDLGADTTGFRTLS
jgi:hypothetical protein